ncbi:Rv2175c family DNA-binding protein [Actinocorallia longicatena]|uniref:Rv2175c family DNA-binding protein n=1 Tax=Actinocorallia longicatena TaxID=111803 RepID=A0ABP6QB42_9ACTN
MTSTHVDIDEQIDALVGDWYTLAAAGEALGVTASRVKQWVKEGKLLAVYRRTGGGPQVPAGFIADREIIKGLAGTLTLLQDAGFDTAETLRWLFTEDDSLPGSPVQAMRENRGTEIRRRAQALAL